MTQLTGNDTKYPDGANEQSLVFPPETIVPNELVLRPAGSTLTIAGNDEDWTAGVSGSIWKIRIDVFLRGVRRRLGIIQTVPPSSKPPYARVLALCYCPGATAWCVSVTNVVREVAPIGQAGIEITLASDLVRGNSASAPIVVNPPFATLLT